MSQSISTGLQNSGTNREYKFQDYADEPAVIPESWAEEAAHEDGDGERFFAVEIRLGQLLEYTVDRNGQPIKGPHVEPAAEVGTVKAERRDAYRALVRELYEVDN